MYDGILELCLSVTAQMMISNSMEPKISSKANVNDVGVTASLGYVPKIALVATPLPPACVGQLQRNYVTFFRCSRQISDIFH
jgi:hypothetical protein